MTISSGTSSRRFADCNAAAGEILMSSPDSAKDSKNPQKNSPPGANTSDGPFRCQGDVFRKEPRHKNSASSRCCPAIPGRKHAELPASGQAEPFAGKWFFPPGGKAPTTKCPLFCSSSLCSGTGGVIRVFNKTLKSILLGRRIAASGHCR